MFHEVINRWCDDHIQISDRKGWSWFVVAHGDVRGGIDRSASHYLEKRLAVAMVGHSLCTVVYMRDGDIGRWRRAGGYLALRNCIRSVLSEADGRRFFPGVFARADATVECKAKATRRIEESRKRNERRRAEEFFRRDIRGGFSDRSTVRGAAGDSL